MHLSMMLSSPLFYPSSVSNWLPSSQFINPSPFRISFHRDSLTRTEKYSPRILFVRSSAKDSVAESEKSVSGAIFGGKKELTVLQQFVNGLSPTIRLAYSAILVGAAVAVGYKLGVRYGGSRNAGIGGVVALATASSAAVYAMNSCIPEVAAVNLHNLLAGYDDPTALNKEEVDGIIERYGVSKQDESFIAELCDLYNRFVSSILPPGSENLRGDEAETIIKFKHALGIDDPDAASVHMEIGRRIFRQRLETGDHEADLEQRRAFQKLIYVSTLVFGEASTFLLPWKRIFKISDAQVEIAIRDNAQILYAFKLKSIDRAVDAKDLIGLREVQLQYKLSDELAAEMFREHTRKLVEQNISTALDILKSRTRAAGREVIEELDKIIAFNNQLVSLSSNAQSGGFAPGVGPVSLIGGEYDGDRKLDGLKLLYKAYATESFSSDTINENKLVALNHLKNIFGLGKREAQTIMLEVTSKVYRKRLGQAVTGGDLEAADSKATFLQNLCEELHFDPQKASEMHEEIYRQKLQLAVADGKLDDVDVSALLRLRVLLCIPQNSIEAAHFEVCGSLFEKVVKDAISRGSEGYRDSVRDSVREAVRGLRLTREASLEIAGRVVRKMFGNYINQAQATTDKTKSAQVLRQLISFNGVVVTKLVDDIKGESTETTLNKADELQKEDEEKWEYLPTLRKTRPTKKLQGTLGKPPQTEITLKDDLPLNEKIQLYRTYLEFLIKGEVIKTPMGGTVTAKKSDSDYLLLNYLGGILGLTEKEVFAIHLSLAEKDFIKGAEVILADGKLDDAKFQQLSRLEKQIGIPPQYAQKIIKNITTNRVAEAVDTALNQGSMSIEQIRQLKAAGVDFDSMISERQRVDLFKKTVDKVFSSGTGEFDEEEVYVKIPLDLGLNADKAKGIVHELAKARLLNSLIQAVSLLRQKNRAGVVSSVNDIVACDKAQPGEPMSWEVQEELADIFAIYQKSNPTPEKLSRVQYLLGISDMEAATFKDKGDVLPLTSEEEFVF